MKKVLALMLAIVMVLCVCGCSKNQNDTSVMSAEVEYQQIIMDENGNVITSLPTTSSNADDNTSDTQSGSNETTSDGNSSNPNNDYINIDYDTVVEVDLCDDVIRGYLDATTAERQFSWLKEYSGIRYDYQAIELDWFLDLSSVYTITFSENADFSNPYIVTTKYSKVENIALIPGRTYYWKVTGTISDDILGGGKIRTKDAPVRWVTIGGVGNVRDMGGWKAEGGKTVKYGMLYRGQRLESITEEGIANIKQLGLKTELDIRYASQKNQTPGTGLNYEFIESPGQYDNVMKSDPDVFKASYKRVFELLADESNYPFYAHCNAGADRTGTFAFIVNGVLGVSYEDLTRDFELTSFGSSSTTAKRWRADDVSDKDGQMNILDTVDKNKTSGNYVAWGILYNEMMEYGAKNGCTTLQQSIDHWLTSYIGVPKANIDSFKSIVLE